MQEKIDQVKELVIEAHKLLLEVLVENTIKEPQYKEYYIDRMYDSSKMLLDVTRKLD
jgi:hypothetical protein